MLDQIRLRLRQTPFQPFEIRCTNGDVYRVEHPENASVVAHKVIVALPNGDDVCVLSALHIVSVSGSDLLAA